MSSKAAQKTFNRHLITIQRGSIDRSTVIGLRKAFNARARKNAGWSIGMTSALMSQMEVNQLHNAIEAIEPRCLGELHTGGLKVLRSPKYAKRLASVAQIVHADDLTFRLIRFDMIGTHSQYACPMYRAVSLDHGSFIFRNIPWQSGGKGPEIYGKDF